jgi:hypothetical protein
VKYASGSAFRTALETRLNNEQSEGVGVSRLWCPAHFDSRGAGQVRQSS